MSDGPSAGSATNSRIVPATDPVLNWEGVAGLEAVPGGVRPWRLPHDRIDLFPGDDLQRSGRTPAGARIVLRTDSRTIALDLTVCTEEIKPVDVVVDGDEVTTLPLEPASPATGSGTRGSDPGPDRGAPAGRRQRVAVRGLGPTRKTVEIWLPHFGEAIWHSVEVDGSASVEGAWRERPRWITYGSSITQCRQAPTPSATWPALAAREAGLDLRCLGFGGQAKLDPMVARLIRDAPADVISLCFGINLHGQAFERLFLPSVLGFVATVRDGHPRVPILVMSPIFSPNREEAPGHAAGMTLVEIRAAVADGVRRLRESGDDNLHLVDGLDILGPSETRYLPDGLHPDGPGYALMASRIAPRLARVLAPAPAALPTPKPSPPRFHDHEGCRSLATPSLHDHGFTGTPGGGPGGRW